MKNKESGLEEDNMDINEIMNDLNITDTEVDQKNEQGAVDKMVDDDITASNDNDQNDEKSDNGDELKEELEIEKARFIMPRDTSNIENSQDAPPIIKEIRIVNITDEELQEEKEKLIHNEGDIEVPGYNNDQDLPDDDKNEFVGESEGEAAEEDNNDYEGNVVFPVTSAALKQQKLHLVHSEGYSYSEEGDPTNSSQTLTQSTPVLGTNGNNESEDE